MSCSTRNCLADFIAAVRKANDSPSSKSLIDPPAESQQDSSSSLLQFEEGVPDLLDTISLRKYILIRGLPVCSSSYEMDNLRSKVWKVLLGVPCIFDANRYISAVEKGPSEFDSKIKDDSFRTFKGNTAFWDRVDEACLVRVLNAIAAEFGYVQGMNVLLGPLAYVMPELESYYSFHTLLSKHIKNYVLKNLDGVHVGISLFKRCFELVDPQLHSYIASRIPDLKIFALRYILTLFANTKPFAEVLRLWDAMFAFDTHLNILLLCALLMLHRERIMQEQRGAKILALLEELSIDSERLVRGALSLVRFIPSELFDELVQHSLLEPTAQNQH